MQPEPLIPEIRFLDKRWYIAMTTVFLSGCLMFCGTLGPQRTMLDLVKQVRVAQKKLIDIRLQRQQKINAGPHLAKIKSLSIPMKPDVWLNLHRLPLQHWQQTSTGLEISFMLSWPDTKKVIPLLPDLLAADQTIRYRIVKQLSALLLTVWIDDETH